MHTKKSLIIATLTSGVLLPAKATIITDNFTGIVTTISGSTPFTTLQLGSSVTGSLTYNSVLASGPDANGDWSITGADPNASFVVNDLVGLGGTGPIGALNNLTFSPTGTPISLSAGTTGLVYAFGANSLFTFANDSGQNGEVTVSFAPRNAPDVGRTSVLLGFALAGLSGFRRLL